MKAARLKNVVQQLIKAKSNLGLHKPSQTIDKVYDHCSNILILHPTGSYTLPSFDLDKHKTLDSIWWVLKQFFSVISFRETTVLTGLMIQRQHTKNLRTRCLSVNLFQLRVQNLTERRPQLRQPFH